MDSSLKWGWSVCRENPQNCSLVPLMMWKQLSQGEKLVGVCVHCSHNCVYMCILLSIVSVWTVCCFLPLPKPLPLLWCGGSQLKVGTTSSQAQRRVHSLHCVCFQEHTCCLSVLCIRYMHSLISSPIAAIS